EYIDKNLDKANLRGLNQVTIIHGFGTGALKKAIKEYLSSSPYVAKFHYGDETQGREGVVIVDLA
ncbi:Smr/MutS family protein, partial [bacterium]|nr:Smr/MutS family protein [bacterium]